MVGREAHPREVRVTVARGRRRADPRGRGARRRALVGVPRAQLGARRGQRRAVPRRPLEPDLPGAPRRSRVRAAPAAVRQQGEVARTTWAASSPCCRKLAPVYDRAPRPYRVRADRRRARRAVLPDGAPARRDPAQGRCPPSSPTITPRVRRVCEHLVDALVELHAVDYAAAGLGDFGKPAGYIERQVTGWTERYAGSQTDDIAGDHRGRRVARRAPARRGCARADPQRLQVRQRDLRSRARADHRRARLGDGDDRRSADGPRHLAVVLGRGRRSAGLSPAAVRPDREARHADARGVRRALPRALRPPRPTTSSSTTRSACSRPPWSLQQIYYRCAKGLTSDARFAR